VTKVPFANDMIRPHFVVLLKSDLDVEQIQLRPFNWTITGLQTVTSLNKNPLFNKLATEYKARWLNKILGPAAALGVTKVVKNIVMNAVTLCCAA
jgi:hypothetical protein